MEIRLEGDELRIGLEGRISADNAGIVEAEVLGALDKFRPKRVQFDAAKLDYISSAGLRVVVKVLRGVGDARVDNASHDVYDVFEMTGISSMMEVHRALREVSVEGCELIGRGGNGEVWRLDEETIIKVYNPGASLKKIQDENAHATAAFTAGIPCAIAFDTVRVGERYGIVFEMLDATTVGHAVHGDPSRIPELGRAMGNLLRELHGTHMGQSNLPRMTDKLSGWINFLEDTYLTHEDAELMRSLAAAVPERDTLLHLDFHEGNVMVQGGELVLIDLDDVCVGNPVFDLINHYSGHVMAAEQSPNVITESMGMSVDEALAMYRETLAAYFGTDDDAIIERHSQSMGLLMLFALVLFMAKSKDSRNMSPERAQVIVDTIVPKLRAMAPRIEQVLASFS